jgi:tight adherence protein C
MYIIIFIFFLSAFMFSYGLLYIIFNDKIIIKKRTQKIKQLENEGKISEKEKSFFERTLMPFYKGLSRSFLKATPSHKIGEINKKLDRAGMLKNYNAEKWIFAKGMIALIFSALFGILIYRLEPNFLKTLVFIVLVILSVNTFLNFFLLKRIEARKQNIIRDLPYTLDLITVSVEAGLSFDGAMARVVNNINGDLCDEFAKSLKEVRMGIQRKIALKNMSERCDVKELSMLITSIVQADELGVSLSRVLRIESANLREHRKQAAREKAMKAPVKMLFPLIFFIFPSIFIIILGPAVIKMIGVFSGK